MSYKLLPILPFLALLSLGCKSTADIAPITANLYVRYMAPEQTLQAEATFYEGDTLPYDKAISFPAGVAFLGSGMTFNEVPGIAPRYQALRQLSTVGDSLRFSFQEPQQEGLTTISLTISAIDSAMIIGTPNLKDGIALRLPAPLAADETLLMLLTGPDKQTRTLAIEGPTAAAQTKVPGPALTEFTAGSYQLFLVAKKDSRTKQGHILVNSSVEYYSHETTIRLE